MAKKVKIVTKLLLEAGKASPAPPVGPALVPHGINLMQFCKDYNARTGSMLGNVVPAEVTIFQDGSFTFVLKTPPVADLLRKASGVEKGSAEPNRDKVGQITRDQLRDIAQTKMRDLNAVDIEGAIRQIEGTARSMGIEIVG